MKGRRTYGVNTILSKLRSDNPIGNVRAIVACVGRNSCTADEAKAITMLAEKNDIVLGYSVSEFAHAAMDMLQIRQYTGDDSNVKALIKGMPSADWVKEVTAQVLR